jgi:hypothetical protein
MLLKIVYLLVFLTAFRQLPAQKIMVNGSEGNRLLQWTDFTGSPDNGSPYLAHTAWKTNVKYTGVTFEGEKAVLQGFEMTLAFDPQTSWVKRGKESNELLKHEQGHFDVGVLYMREAVETIARTTFSRAGYKEEFQKIIRDLYQKYVSMGDQYDTETNHSIKKEEQEKWNAFFGEKVRR